MGSTNSSLTQPLHSSTTNISTPSCHGIFMPSINPQRNNNGPPPPLPPLSFTVPVVTRIPLPSTMNTVTPPNTTQNNTTSNTMQQQQTNNNEYLYDDDLYKFQNVDFQQIKANGAPYH